MPRASVDGVSRKQAIVLHKRVSFISHILFSNQMLEGHNQQFTCTQKGKDLLIVKERQNITKRAININAVP